MFIRFLLILSCAAGFWIHQSNGMAAEQFEYTVTSNAPEVKIIIGSLEILGKPQNNTFFGPYVDAIRFSVADLNTVRIDRTHLQGDLEIRIIRLPENQYTVIIKRKNDVQQIEHHF